MSEMRIVNIRLPVSFERKIGKASSREYTGLAEFIRSSVVKMLMKLGVMPQSVIIDIIRSDMRARMTARGEVFDEERELNELKRIREEAWRKKYAGSARH